MIRRPPRSTLDRSSAASDVYKRQIPAIFGVTQDPFIVFTSNIFAILGLRSLYFLLAAVVDKFYLLKYGLAVILTFVGVKMLGESFFHIDIVTSLGIILG